MKINRYNVQIYKYPARETSVYKQRHIAFFVYASQFPCIVDRTK